MFSKVEKSWGQVIVFWD